MNATRLGAVAAWLFGLMVFGSGLLGIVVSAAG